MQIHKVPVKIELPPEFSNVLKFLTIESGINLMDFDAEAYMLSSEDVFQDLKGLIAARSRFAVAAPHYAS